QANYTATIVRGGADCVLSADAAGNNNYVPAHAGATITINKAAQTITSFTAPTAAVTYAPPGTFPGTATAASPHSGQVVTITTHTTSNGTTSVAISGAGTCSTTANQAGNLLYNVAPPVTQCFTVNQAGQTIVNFPAILPKTYGVDGPFPVSPNQYSSAGFPV